MINNYEDKIKCNEKRKEITLIICKFEEKVSYTLNFFQNISSHTFC